MAISIRSRPIQSALPFLALLLAAAFRAPAAPRVERRVLHQVAGRRTTIGEVGRLTVRLDRPGVKISPMLYGLMTEEINHSYDGGLYGELIRNRSFNDDPRTPAHWSLIEEGGGTGTDSLDRMQPVSGTALAASLRLEIASAGAGGRVGVANDGYWGIPVRSATLYRASFYARAGGGFDGPLTADLESGDGTTLYCRARTSSIGPAWKRYTVTLKTGTVTPSSANRFVLSAASPGTVWLAQVSLFPPTYKGRPNGNRIDLMRKLGDMHPAFLRLPGGNYLEGTTIAERFDWKKTIHDLAQRPGHQGPWGYRSTDGMGILEFLEWCEDLRMKPVLAVFAGYALNGEHVAAGPKLTPFVQDALDEIEYATGRLSTHWGAQRAADGHPAPFKIEYVEIGNEDGFDRSGSYDGRFAQFHDAIKAWYPNLKLIATARVRTRRPDVLDDHYYRSAAAMERDVHHYDAYSRAGPKIFVGEWASTEGRPTPNFGAALGDAAWLTGLERNSDLVIMESYAPLLVNINRGASQWGTNLIGYDALNSFGSPSYYVQAMFGGHRGDVALPVNVEAASVAPAQAPLPRGRIGVGTWNTQAEFKEIRVTQSGATLYRTDFAGGASGWKWGAGRWRAEAGVLRQSGSGTDCRATAGDDKWTDYTYSLKARKLGGSEGFLILFHVRGSGDLVWWNIGGWGNTRTALESIHAGGNLEIGQAAPVTVETGKWYDIRVEVRGRGIRCFLDGRLISQAADTSAIAPGPIFAAASLVRTTGELILKVVNVGAADQPLRIELKGARVAARTAKIETLKGRPEEINTLSEPRRIAPRTMIIGTDRAFVYKFPPYSVTVLQVKVRARRK